MGNAITRDEAVRQLEKMHGEEQNYERRDALAWGIGFLVGAGRPMDPSDNYQRSRVVIFLNDSTGDYTVLNRQGHRSMSGDLVGHFVGTDFHVEPQDFWLFAYEVKDENTYARRKQREGVIKLRNCLADRSQQK